MASGDDSQLDNKYFIDERVYNCPFCNRRHVSYHVCGRHLFNWAREKQCFVYTVQCESCRRVSMHLSYDKIGIASISYGDDEFRFEEPGDLDSRFFYSAPTSFFVLDGRIPRVIRELVTEAEGCRKMNFLTGASACARKAIYEFLVHEKAEGDHYEDKIKSLTSKFSSVDPELFEVLAHIHDMTSDKVHEQSWPKWDSQNLSLMIETLKAVLHEVYVVPAERSSRSGKIRQLRHRVHSAGGTPTE